MDFVSELVRKRGKENLQKFIQFVVEILKRYTFRSFLFSWVQHFNICSVCWLYLLYSCSHNPTTSRYDDYPLEHKPYRQKDGALLAIGALCDKLKQTAPYKSELERMLVQYVFSEFNSPAGHLRAKVCRFFLHSSLCDVVVFFVTDTFIFSKGQCKGVTH